tara:strand:- start:3046 stop:4110 length:1065 start_codon:yes stop_codon:yes gene_type:complete
LIRFKKTLSALKRKGNYETRSKFILNLDRNENIRGLNIKQRNKLYNKLKKININFYPNLKNTYKKLSKFLKVSSEKILITEGVSGGIKNILDSIDFDKNSEIIIPKPTFALYEIYSKLYGIKIKTFNYSKSFELDHFQILKLINKNTMVVFLPLPNIPIEGIIDYKVVQNIAKKLYSKKILLAIDEVYFPFGKITFKNLINNFDNVVIMRSFSKSYGLAGARIGCLISNKKNINIFNNTKGGYETNILSAKTLEFAIENNHISNKYVKDTKSGMNYLKNKLDLLKIEYFGGVNGNFIFINLKNSKKAQKIYKRLKDNKIATRYSFIGQFRTGILVTGCPKLEMKKFVKIFIKLI